MNKTQKEQISKAMEDRTERITLHQARDILYEQFRTNLRLLRAYYGLSGCEASDQIGLKNGKRMLDLEYGRGIPSMDEMLLIAKFFEVDIDSLLHKKGTIVFDK